MSVAATLLDQARTDGVTLRLAEPGKLKLRGDPEAVARWAPLLRPHKAALVALLTEPRPTWHIREPDGNAWGSTFAPAQTWAAVLDRYQAATTAVPVLDPDIGEPLPPDIEALVLGFLDRIGEDDPTTRREALDLAARRPDIAQGYRDRADRPAPPASTPDGTGTHGTDPKEPSQ